MAQPKPGSFSAFAAKITQAAAVIDAHFENTNTPPPSFDVDAPDGLPFVPEVQLAKIQLLDALEDLQLLTSGPSDVFSMSLIGPVHDAAVYRVFCDFNVWEAVPLDGTATYPEIAARTGLGADTAARLIRHAQTKRVFAAPAPGVVAHSALSAFFVKQPLARAWIGHNTEEVFVADTKLSEAIQTWGESGEPTETASRLASWPDKTQYASLWDFMENDERAGVKGFRVKRFGDAMKFVTRNPAFNVQAIHRLYDFTKLGEGPFVDIGGSLGHVSQEIASQNPSLKFIVEDLPAVEAPFHSALPASFSAQISFRAHDFFTPQPVAGAAVYFLKHILHDWSDKYATKILQQIVPVLTRPGARVLIMEAILPELDEAPRPLVRMMTTMDLQMMVALNARERSVKNWTALIEGVGGGLELKQVHTTPGSAFALIEAGLGE